MPKLTASKEEVKGLPILPEGMYTVRLDGFSPKYSKDRASINLNPQMRIINNPEYNDRIVFDNLNTKGKWVWVDFCHGFGIELVDTGGDVEFPGDFDGPTDDPEKWVYRGPLQGQQAQLYVIQSEYQGKENNKIKFYQCKIPSCTIKHSANLAK